MGTDGADPAASLDTLSGDEKRGKDPTTNSTR